MITYCMPIQDYIKTLCTQLKGVKGLEGTVDKQAKEIEWLKRELAKYKLKWQTGKPPRQDLYRARKYINLDSEDCGFGFYDESDGLICGLTGTWCIDPMKEEWVGPIPEPE